MSGWRFTLVERAGRGAHGVVYRARLRAGEGFERWVALKLVAVGEAQEGSARARLRDEGRLLGLVAHPALVEVLDLLWLRGPQGPPRLAIVMAWVPGLDLDALLARIGRLPPRASLELVGELASALAAAAEAPGPDGAPLGLIHRDLKPSNVRVTRDGAVKLLDLGVARARLPERAALTQGEVYGTRGYVAPERLAGGEDLAAGDVYSLGAVLYECLAGRPLGVPSDPTRSPNAWVLGRLRALEVALPELPAPALRLLERMLSQDPALRPAAAEVAEGCHAVIAGLPRGGLRALLREAVPAEAPTDSAVADPMIGQVWEPAGRPGIGVRAAVAAPQRGGEVRAGEWGCLSLSVLLGLGLFAPQVDWYQAEREGPIAALEPVRGAANAVASPAAAPAAAEPALGDKVASKPPDPARTAPVEPDRPPPHGARRPARGAARAEACTPDGAVACLKIEAGDGRFLLSPVEVGAGGEREIARSQTLAPGQYELRWLRPDEDGALKVVHSLKLEVEAGQSCRLVCADPGGCGLDCVTP